MTPRGSLSGRHIGFVKGDLVDYKSGTYQCWIPAVVLAVEPESGDLQLDVKPQPIRLQDQEHILRPRQRPTREHIEWMHVVMRDGRLTDEVQVLWARFALSYFESQAIPRAALPSLAGQVDSILGTSGSLKAFMIETQKDNRDCLTLEGFESAFWLQLSNALHSYGQALPIKNGEVYRRENPGNVYNFDEDSVKTLGMGTFGKVKLVRERRTRAKRAVKCISKAKVGGFVEMLDAEVENLCLMDHPNIARLYEYFDWGENIYLVMDYCSGGELQHKIRDAQRSSKPLKEAFVKDVTRQVLLAISHIHAHGIVHLDVKSANIMLMPSRGTRPPVQCENEETMAPPRAEDIPHVMVIDLGVSQIFRPGNFRHNQPMGTPATMAPEVWRGEITPKADVFSTGVVLYEMMALRLPLMQIPCNRADAIRFWAAQPAVNWSLVRARTEGAVELCKTMMKQQRHHRPTAWNCLHLEFLQEANPSEAPTAVPPGILQSVKRFPERSVLYKSIALSMARRWPANQWPTVQRWFKDLDIEHSGRIERPCMSGCLQRHSIDAQLADRIAEAMDLDCDGSISWTEFMASCIHLGSSAFEQTLQEAFQEADSDDDGLLTQNDLSKLFPASSGTEAVRSSFIGLTGRSEPGARVDWPTFRRHFRSQAMSADDVDRSASAGLDLAPRRILQSFPEMLEFAREAADKVRSRLFPQPGDPELEEAQLRQLAGMGFDDRESCLSVLRRHRGQLSDSAVEELVRLCSS